MADSTTMHTFISVVLYSVLYTMWLALDGRQFLETLSVKKLAILYILMCLISALWKVTTFCIAFGDLIWIEILIPCLHVSSVFLALPSKSVSIFSNFRVTNIFQYISAFCFSSASKFSLIPLFSTFLPLLWQNCCLSTFNKIKVS